MYEIRWSASVHTGSGLLTREGTVSVSEGAVHIRPDLGPGTIESVRAEIGLELSEGERIFMNGFQTWTYCPEYGARSRIRGLHGVPKLIVDRFHLDRYGDYGFVDYPNRKGIVHGESWCYFRTGNSYRLVASLSERAGYTLFSYDASEGKLTVERDAKGVRVDGEYDCFDLCFFRGTEDEVFDSWFSAMGVRPMTDRKLAGYCSWYNRYQDISEETILDDLNNASKVLKEGDLFQVDDGWETFVGDWTEPDASKFPNGMKAVADAIHEAGYKAGLWLAPYVCQKGSAVMREHPDWLLKVNGDIHACGVNWGGFYSLDIDNEECLAYVRRSLERATKEWGFDLVKLDFLYGAAPVGSEKESRGGRMERAMDLLREFCGGAMILGCGVPVMSAFGKVEYCRVSCDVSLDWDDKPYMRLLHRERNSTRHALETSILRRQLNGRAYLCDPDVFFLRDNNLKLSAERKAMLARADALIGGFWLTSDNFAAYSERQAEEYGACRELFERAENVRIENVEDGVFLIHYAIDGREAVQVADTRA